MNPSTEGCNSLYMNGLVQEIHNSIADALELCLSFTNPSICMQKKIIMCLLSQFSWNFVGGRPWFSVLWCVCTVHPKIYAHSLCLVAICYGSILPIFFRVTSLALGQYTIAPVPGKQPWKICMWPHRINPWQIIHLLNARLQYLHSCCNKDTAILHQVIMLT